MKRIYRALVLFACIFSTKISAAAEGDSQNLFYAEYGQWDSAREGAIGIQLPGPFQFSAESRWVTFWDAELGVWFTKKDSRNYVTSAEGALGAVGRYYWTERRDFYFEGVAGIGLIAPRFWRDSEQQGSIPNFAGGFGFGYRFADAHSSEISLRAEHFSDGGFRDPNPGRNFFQLRYGARF
jgi:lipid A 3-O-deacylase